MKPFGLFINPENHVPALEEMKHTYAKKHGSVLEKVLNTGVLLFEIVLDYAKSVWEIYIQVSVLQPGTLLRLIIGENAFQRIHGTPLSSELHDKMRTIREKHQSLQAE